MHHKDLLAQWPLRVGKLCLLLLAGFCFLSACSTGNKQEVTFILLRHAEKDSVGTDPSLSPAGKARAARLPERMKGFRPDAFFSTPTTRTRQTLAPWASQSHLNLISYDATRQQSLADSLRQQSGKTFVIVGHSNTIPGFVNRLAGQPLYRNLPDTVFRRIWIVRIRNGKAVVTEEFY